MRAAARIGPCLGSGFAQSRPRTPKAPEFMPIMRVKPSCCRRTLGICSMIGSLAANACGGGSAAWNPPTTPTNAAPIIAAVSPLLLIYQGLDTVITVEGANFAADAIVLWNGEPRATVVASKSRLTASLLRSDLRAVDSVPVIVKNQSAGLSSQAIRVTIGYPIPILTAISPTTIEIADFEMLPITITGSGFRFGSVVNYRELATGNRTNLRPSNPTPTTIQTALYLSVLGGRAGMYAVTVTNPTPGGGVTDTIKILATYPVPIVTGVERDTIRAGIDTEAVVLGSHFSVATTVTWNGQPHAAHILNSLPTRLIIPLAAADVATPGVVMIGVITPPPGGGPASASTKVVVVK